MTLTTEEIEALRAELAKFEFGIAIGHTPNRYGIARINEIRTVLEGMENDEN